MKISNWLALPLLVSCSSLIASTDNILSVSANAINISTNGYSRTCQLDQTPRFAVESFDKSALIVSERGYIPIKSLANCNAVAPIPVSLIPEGVGVLTDINLTKGLYVALDFVNVQPFLYLATVAHIGSSRNLITLDGAYVSGRSLSAQRKRAFGGSGDAGSAIISPDGRFVAPTAEISCANDAYPGVWDVTKNKHVLTDDASCSRLFESK